MIRRDAKLDDGSAAWVLVSQIEHARISAQLAAHCTGRFGAGEVSDELRREVLAAIRHHDDGWNDWEHSPRLDVDSGKPLSFMELDAAEAIPIWNRSIDAAATYGPLATWMVAGHFSRLTRKYSDATRTDPQAIQWYDGMQQRRAQWLTQWQADEPATRTAALAEEALQWLWSFDEVSLWFCCTCPAAGQRPQARSEPPAKPAGQGTPIEMQLAASGNGLAGATPWLFDSPGIDIEASARVVPAQRYKNVEALFAAAAPHTLRWQFLAPIERHLA
jgi:hypothetical protein